MPRLWSILGNSQRLDGGAMFGSVPRAMWERWVQPDERSRIPLACRALLVEHDGRRILFEAGIGAFFAPKLRDRYGVLEDSHVLVDNLAQAGFPHESIDIVVLSHLHFDHAGGLLAQYQDGRPPELLFPNATFITGEKGFERARSPHSRDRASFIPDLPALLEQSNRLELASGTTSETLGSGFKFWFSDGHTPGLMLTEIATQQGPLVFAADLIPGAPWVHLPVTMGYDRNAELVVDEKAELLEYTLRNEGRLFYFHDAGVAASRVTKDAKGRFIATEPQAELIAEQA